MFAVETYAAVRRFVFIAGKSRGEAARVFGLSRDTIAKMCRYSSPPGYVRKKAPERPKLGPLIPVIDTILEADKGALAEAAAYGEADFRTAAGRARFFWRLHGREGLCAASAHALTGGFHSTRSSAGPCAGRFWRKRRLHWRRADEAACVLLRPATFGRLLHQGLCGGDDGSLPRRPCLGLCVFWRRTARYFTTTPSLRWRRS